MTKRFKAKYTAGDILELYRIRSKEGDEGRIQRLAREFRAYTRLEHDVTIPPEYKAITKEVRTPFIRDAWHRITSSLVAKPPVAHVIPKNEKRQDYRNSANVAERFDMAMIERFNKQLGIDIIYNLEAQQVRDGESILKVAHRKDAWANFPDGMSVEEQDEWKHGVDLPFIWRDVDRLNILHENGEYGDHWVMEYGEYAKPFLKATYGMREDDQGRLITPGNMIEGRPHVEGLAATSTGRVVKLEFFDADEWHVIIDLAEAPGWPKPNPYKPYLPYFRAPAYDSESLLYSLMFLVPRMDELLTMKLNWATLSAYPNPVIETVPSAEGIPALDGPVGNMGDATSVNSPVIWSPGKLMELPSGKKLSFLAPPPTGKDLNDLIQIFKNLIDVAGIPSVMRGMSNSGDSGYLASQLRAAAAMAYRLAALSSQRQLEQATEFTHWMISHIVRQTVYVLGWTALNARTGKPKRDSIRDWLGLSPDKSSNNIGDISKLGPVSFQFRPTLPTDEQARAMIALQLTNASKPLLDRRYAIENYLQEEDPDAIIEAIYIEEELNQEPLRTQVREAALRDAGLLPKPPNPVDNLVGPDGMPLQPGGSPLLPPPPGQIQNIPLENMPQPGMPGVPGITMPQQPAPPQGIPGAPGGRPVGMYPGMPGNQGPGG